MSSDYVVEYTYTPPDLIEKVPEDRRSEVQEEIATFLLESILEHVGSGKSPVAGGKFKSTLSSEYAERKGDNLANLDLTGDMLRALEFKISKDGSITFGVWDDDQAPKFYNHQVGDTLPRRQVLPEEEQSFKREINAGVKRIIEEYLE